MKELLEKVIEKHIKDHKDAFNKEWSSVESQLMKPSKHFGNCEIEVNKFHVNAIMQKLKQEGFKVQSPRVANGMSLYILVEFDVF